MCVCVRRAYRYYNNFTNKTRNAKCTHRHAFIPGKRIIRTHDEDIIYIYASPDRSMGEVVLVLSICVCDITDQFGNGNGHVSGLANFWKVLRHSLAHFCGVFYECNLLSVCPCLCECMCVFACRIMGTETHALTHTHTHSQSYIQNHVCLSAVELQRHWKLTADMQLWNECVYGGNCVHRPCALCAYFAAYVFLCVEIELDFKW